MVAGCQSYLERFTWRHDSILNCLAKALQVMNLGNIYADIPEFRNPSILTGDVYRPDLLLVTPDKSLYILELTVGYETNLHKNVVRKREKYHNLVKEQSKHFYSVKFINLSISSLGIFDKKCSSFIDMLNTLGMDKKTPTVLYGVPLRSILHELH